MQEQTIVAVFATDTHAEAALRDLQAAGIPDDALSRHVSIDTVPGYGVQSDTLFETPPRSGFWSRLFGVRRETEMDTASRDHAAGGAIVTVETSEAAAAEVIAVLERHELIDLDENVTDIRT